MKSKNLAIILVFLFLGCGILFGQDKKESKKATVVFDVSMTCEKCKKKIEKNIAYEKGVSDMTVDLQTKTVTIVYRKDKTSTENLQKALEKLGYTVSIHNYELKNVE